MFRDKTKTSIRDLVESKGAEGQELFEAGWKGPKCHRFLREEDWAQLEKMLSTSLHPFKATKDYWDLWFRSTKLT